MKRETRNVTTYKTIFIADDGTEFTTEEACKSYEATAKCEVRAMYAKRVVATTNEYALFGAGSEDEPIDFVKISDFKDLTAINTYAKSLGVPCPLSEEAIGTVQLVVRGYDGDWCGFMGTIDNVITGIKKTYEEVTNGKL